jgi:hypothetical protein
MVGHRCYVSTLNLWMMYLLPSHYYVDLVQILVSLPSTGNKLCINWGFCNLSFLCSKLWCNVSSGYGTLYLKSIAKHSIFRISFVKHCHHVMIVYEKHKIKFLSNYAWLRQSILYLEYLRTTELQQVVSYFENFWPQYQYQKSGLILVQLYMPPNNVLCSRYNVPIACSPGHMAYCGTCSHSWECLDSLLLFPSSKITGKYNNY